MKNSDLYKLIKKRFYYQNGELYYKSPPKFGKAKKHNLVGDKRSRKTQTKRYRTISIDCKTYRKSRIIYLFHHGKIPNGKVIDHINNDITDDRIENLRAVTVAENAFNRVNNKNNKLRYITKHKGSYTFQMKNSKIKILKRFKNLDEAISFRDDFLSKKKFDFLRKSA